MASGRLKSRCVVGLVKRIVGKSFRLLVVTAGLAVSYVVLSLMGPLWVYWRGEVDFSRSWRSLDRSSVGLAPSPGEERKAVLQVYAARAYNWRGLFAVHPWIAYKGADEDRYVVLEILGWRAMGGGDSISVSTKAPDGKWFGNPPELLFETRGREAETVMGEIVRLAEHYPYRNFYRAYPGPNSNTFVSHLIREIPALDFVLPSTAIGQRYPVEGEWFAWHGGGKGFSVSFRGHAGFSVGSREGFRFFLFGAEWGINPLSPSLFVPGVGRIPG